MSALVGFGILATAWVMHKRPRGDSVSDMSTCASARVSEPVHARAEEAVEEVVENSEDMFDSLWGLTPEGEKQMSMASVPKTDASSERVRQATLDVKPMHVDSLGSKGLGTLIPVIGRDVETNMKQPKVSGGCMFYMSDRYAHALENQ